MLGALLALGFFGAAGAKATYDNYDMKKYTSHYDNKGNLHYMDNQCRDYINGERVRSETRTDQNGIDHYRTVGVDSGRIYEDSLGRGTKQSLDLSESFKQTSIRSGNLAYNQYNPYFHEFVTTEIATERTITCLFKGTNSDGKMTYRKWYFRPECQGKLDYNNTVKGDYGIEITKEEYDGINNIPTISCACLPSDPDVRAALMGL